ncbi:MAG: ATP-dependent RecD-like DNA helicase [Clostridiales bacterium]|nr:ATP-dependent RecD-like DNA helicase [Clostridiales bacterium]
MQEPEKTLEELTGTVERVVFRNDENGWTVLEVEAGGEYHKVVGILPMAAAGEQLCMRGYWTEHPSFGPQFRAEHCEQQLPTDSDAILRYLSSGAVKGIGPSTAVRILEKFGDEALHVLEQEPRRLAEIKGISLRRAMEIGREFAGQFGLREVMLTFSEFGLTAPEALRCYKKWGAATVSMIRENPYLLCSSGLYIGFDRADRICMGMDRPADDPRRIEAGLLYVLRHNLGNGHTCLPRDKLVPAAASMLGVEEGQTEELLTQMLDGAAAPVQERELKGRRFIFLDNLYRAERFIAARLQLMAGFPTQSEQRLEQTIDSIEKSTGLHYESRQREAIHQAVEKGVLILTGGPGTGKTTTLRAIIQVLEGMGETVAIAAPTGRAAKRIAELTGCEAKTLHRLLEVQWDDSDSPAFERNEKNPLDADAVVVDELSMVDVPLFESLLRALKTGCRLIMVGDSDQLPAVGPGSVLHDLMDSGELPAVRLTEVFRQAQESRIIVSAHKIVCGEMPELFHKEGDFFFLAQNSEQGVSATVQDLCARRLPARYGYSVFEGIQVLCPGRKGGLGTLEFNRRLQERLNPPGEGKREITVEGTLLRTGDKVMHVRNNYDIVWTRDNGESGTGVFNGDIGQLEAIDPREGTLSVRFEDRTALYSRQEAQDLELAYAATVHKSQGSEFDAVILPLYHNQRLLCYRNLLYTAVTRAKSLLIIVGSRQTLQEMVENDRKTLRYTGLRAFMEEMGNSSLKQMAELPGTADPH